MKIEGKYDCMCGISLFGDDEAYKQHLEFECPVYAKAKERLMEEEVKENVGN